MSQVITPPAAPPVTQTTPVLLKHPVQPVKPPERPPEDGKCHVCGEAMKVYGHTPMNHLVIVDGEKHVAAFDYPHNKKTDTIHPLCDGCAAKHPEFVALSQARRPGTKAPARAA